MAGLVLDPWEEFVLREALGERAGGKWAAFEVGMVVSRQNGKGAVLEARELAGLFLLGERLIIHSAHQFDTSLEAFRRLLGLIEETPDFSRRVKRVSRSHGEEGIELKGGQRVRFRTRTKGGGRGFTSDCLVLDEAMILPESSHGALLPTLSARPNPQVWYAASAVDRLVHEDGVVLARLRERGLRGDDSSLAFFEWSVDADSPNEVTEAVASDPAAWAVANPGLGIRISEEHIGAELRSMDSRTFAVERLGAGDWPKVNADADAVIPLASWDALVDGQSSIAEGLCLAFDVSPDRGRCTIAAAGARSDGLGHVEIAEHRRGTGWLAGRLAELCEEHEVVAVVFDAAGPAGSLQHEIEAAGVTIEPVTAKEHAQACGRLFDDVANRRLRHLGEPEMRTALKGATKRPLGDAWAWSRKNSGVDISPLVASTLAVWGSAVMKPAETWAVAA